MRKKMSNLFLLLLLAALTGCSSFHKPFYEPKDKLDIGIMDKVQSGDLEQLPILLVPEYLNVMSITDNGFKKTTGSSRFSDPKYIGQAKIYMAEGIQNIVFFYDYASRWQQQGYTEYFKVSHKFEKGKKYLLNADSKDGKKVYGFVEEISDAGYNEMHKSLGNPPGSDVNNFFESKLPSVKYKRLTKGFNRPYRPQLSNDSKAAYYKISKSIIKHDLENNSFKMFLNPQDGAGEYFIAENNFYTCHLNKGNESFSIEKFEINDSAPVNKTTVLSYNPKLRFKLSYINSLIINEGKNIACISFKDRDFEYHGIVIDLKSKKVIKKFDKTRGCFSKDGKYFLTYSKDKINLINLESGSEKEIKHGQDKNSVNMKDISISDNGKYLIMKDYADRNKYDIYLLRLSDNSVKKVGTLNNNVSGFRWLGDDKVVVSAYQEDIISKFPANIWVIKGLDSVF